MFLMVLSVFLTRFYLRAQETPSPHRDFIDALWVATSREILKVAVSDGTILFKVPDTEKVRAVAVDQRGSVVWAYGYKTLSAYAFNGEALFSVSVPQPDNVDGSENGKDKGQNENNGNGNDNVVLNVNPNNGPIWLSAFLLATHTE